MQTLGSFYRPVGECADKTGNVFIADLGNQRIVEYAHGGKKPIATLQDSDGPYGCAIDPATGNLAVTNVRVANVAIYERARGRPKKYMNPSMSGYAFCTYDGKGNLYVDGQVSYSSFALAKLSKGTGTFTNITVNQNIKAPGGVQWLGNGIAIGDLDVPIIYKFSIRGSHGRRVGSTPLGSQAEFVHQFDIDGTTVVVPNQYYVKHKAFSNVLLYKYPGGGKALKTITRGVSFPGASVISKAPN
jgi:hypothetical protein